MENEQQEVESIHRYITFYVGDMFFGIEVLKVQELLRYQEITSVPLAPDVVEGLINLRGQIVTAVDMRRRLNLGPRADGVMPMNIVVRSADGAVSLLVDEIGDVLEPPSSIHEPPPATMPEVDKEIIECVCKLDGKLLLVLNTGRVLQTSSDSVQRSRSEPC
ncbi:MAG: chemotaxis protein CheW [Acidobacteriota bacterium]|nr:chemotaxis protein CheW [Acidobacteriota bacterium]